LPITEGWATNFGAPSDLVNYQRARAIALAAGKTDDQAEKAGLLAGDNGIGHPSLGSVSSPNSYGVALPTSYLQDHLGNDPSAWRTARAQLTVNNQTVSVPIIDVGPGQKQQDKGVVTDVSYPLSQALGGFDMAKAQVSLVPNAGPDYLTNRDAWDREQRSITSSLIGGEPSPTPSLSPAPNGSLADVQQKRQSLGLMN
jgi:hypothetical protein